MEYTHTQEYSAIKMKEILSFAMSWMNLEDIVLSEISWAQKGKNRGWEVGEMER